MSRISPVTTILLRECAGTALAVAAFAYSGWITTILSLSFLTKLFHHSGSDIELHAFFGALSCLLWWTGVAGVRLAGWRPNWPILVGLLLIGVHTIELAVMTVIVHHPA
ncbi:hypothetical protein CDG81_03090 [Actinopolyspora erythraea]|uniref:DUF4345 domain-containing protein n=1 Tax=Actinopolyspora erythraea TaxID=414996 RepID=A0A099D2N0_9ACTN|nr:hypothetical protein [Actinopolyspora erythraea]ASU77458.1 hypothetical protein CDG81_03090 [Actinopolyspora erythraea]KGI80329.1 hypothetical protein IL38_17885 [Actinopolyspora erythraea]